MVSGSFGNECLCSSTGEPAIREPATWGQLSSTGVHRRNLDNVKILVFFAFLLLPVVCSNGGTCTQLFSGGLWSGLCCSSIYGVKQNIAPKWQSALFFFFVLIPYALFFAFAFVLSVKKKNKDVLNIYWLCLLRVLEKQYSCTRFSGVSSPGLRETSEHWNLFVVSTSSEVGGVLCCRDFIFNNFVTTFPLKDWYSVYYPVYTILLLHWCSWGP